MNAIVKKSLQFITWVKNDIGQPKAQRKHLVRRGDGVQSLPDWVKTTDTYKVAESDGTIIEVNVKEPAPAKKGPGRPPKAKADDNPPAGAPPADNDKKPEDPGK